jgi:DNA-binding transcriptional MerR regulator
MKSFLIKDISKKTGISIQTLRYYEKIGLCKASYRRESGYRVYTHDDLITLQKITALKFFKFPLKTIKKILDQKESLIDQLKKQSLCLAKQAEELQQAHAIIEQTIAQNPESAGLSDDIIITLIRMYSMNTLQETKKIFSPDQIQQLKSYVKTISAEEGTAYGELWQALIAEVTKHLDESPRSAVGERHAIAWIALKNKYFQDETINESIWKAYMNDQFKNANNDLYYQIPLSTESPELHLRLPKIPKKVLLWINEAFDYMDKKKK